MRFWKAKQRRLKIGDRVGNLTYLGYRGNVPINSTVCLIQSEDGKATPCRLSIGHEGSHGWEGGVEVPPRYVVRYDGSTNRWWITNLASRRMFVESCPTLQNAIDNAKGKCLRPDAQGAWDRWGSVTWYSRDGAYQGTATY